MSDDHDSDLCDDDPDGVIECWCGATGPYDQLFDDTCLDEGCGGMGTLHCYCGGDQCVCHHHGEVECPGCEDCEGDLSFEDDYDPDDDFDVAVP